MRILVLIIGILLMGVNIYAADGDLIVNNNIGIGTANPIEKITAETTSRSLLRTNTTDTTGVSGAQFSTGGVTRGAVFSAGTNGIVLKANTPASGGDGPPLRLQTNDTDRLWITPAGNVGIGTVNPTYQLELSTDRAAKLSTSVWSTTSDARLKTNIQPYTKGLKEILQITPVNYKYNGKGGIGRYKIKKTNPDTFKDEEIDFVDTELLSKTNIGVIAQDIQAIVPESVSSHKGKINDYDKDETDILDFNAHSLTFILINAVKELKAEIDSLNQQIADLKARVRY